MVFHVRGSCVCGELGRVADLSHLSHLYFLASSVNLPDMFFHLRGKLLLHFATRNSLAHLAVLVKVGLGGESKGAGV